ncbi:hypothetical protein BDDG_12121 [Blastomyces dermatitidis ATCC 18188]|uniref:Uncharacterized protein n=1 Tax=Ajellomyces dermatitidis (strain ATCC 18188 / CBS 674.68) TaxID=653446 RepID=A0A0J9HEC6_AJEDA|nr:hypothetical protein BDDG_12121 [Blastomyces dermatitidis ATCC 18188]
MAPRKRIKKHPLPLSHHTKCPPFHSSSEWVEALTTQQESLNLNLRQSLDTCHGKQEHQASNPISKLFLTRFPLSLRNLVAS